MKAIIEIDVPDWQIGEEVTVLFPDTMTIRAVCERKKPTFDARKTPGTWNGLNGGTHYGTYFDMEDVNRVRAMTEIASALREYGIHYDLTKCKRMYRITIRKNDYFGMDETLKERIWDITYHTVCG